MIAACPQIVRKVVMGESRSLLGLLLQISIPLKLFQNKPFKIFLKAAFDIT